MDELRWGIIGVGRFGQIHARTLAALPGIRVAALCGRRPAELSNLAAEVGSPRIYGDYKQLLNDGGLDVVTVATHWREHFDVARDVLQSGLHLFLEKPLAETREQCLELVRLSRQAAGSLLVGHVCRFDPRVTLAREAILAGRLGRIFAMRSKRNLTMATDPTRLDKIGPLIGDGVHDTDLMLWFLGRPPRRVFGATVRVDQNVHPDSGWAFLDFDDAAGVVESNWRLPEKTPTTIDAVLEVVGTEGQLTIDCGHAGLTIVDARGIREPDTAYWPVQHGRHVGALQNEILYFADCIRQGRRPEVITPAEAARAALVMQTAEASAAVGQPLPYEEPAWLSE